MAQTHYNVRHNFIFLAIISVITFILYVPTLTFDFTYFDDYVWIIQHQWSLKNPANFLDLFKSHDLLTEIFYRPICGASFMLNTLINGQNLFGYRLFNILIHIINANLIYLTLLKISQNKLKTFTLALIFAIHPALVPTVSWIPGRSDSLLGLFIFPSFLFFFIFLNKQKLWQLLLHLIFFFFALLTKETAVVLSFACLSFIWLSKAKLSLKHHLLIFTGWAGVYTIWFLLKQNALHAIEPINLKFAISSLINNSPAMINYFGKTLLPIKLSILPYLNDIVLWPGLICFVGLSIWIIISKTKNLPMILFGIVWFLLFIIPPLMFSYIFIEGRLYVPIMGILIILSELKFPKNILITRCMTILIIILLLIINTHYSQMYKNKFTLWENAAKQSPHLAFAKLNLGIAHYRSGKLDLAKKNYQEALALNPREALIHNNLGIVAMDQGDLTSAQIEFEKEITVNSKDPAVYFNYGELFYRQKKWDLAENFWEKTIQLDPYYYSAYNALIDISIAKNDIQSYNQINQKIKELFK